MSWERTRCVLLTCVISDMIFIAVFTAVVRAGLRLPATAPKAGSRVKSAATSVHILPLSLRLTITSKVRPPVSSCTSLNLSDSLTSSRREPVLVAPGFAM